MLIVGALPIGFYDGIAVGTWNSLLLFDVIKKKIHQNQNEPTEDFGDQCREQFSEKLLIPPLK